MKRIATKKAYKMAKPPSLGPAREELKIALNVMRVNEPINRREGDIAQANLERENAKSYKYALDRLK